MSTDTVESTHKAPIIYWVVPCYNEEDMLPLTARILTPKINSLMASGLVSPTSRVLFVDDGSKDATWSVISILHESDPVLYGGVKLAHNRGHQNALLAGLMTAKEAGCDAAISLDADLQDDINVMDDFIRLYMEGNEIVYGVRSSRQTDTAFKRWTAELFYALFRLFDADTIPDHADYRLMGAQALDALSEYTEVNLFLRGMVPDLGFKTEKVYYKRGVREAGESKYPLKKMISFALQGITSFSTKPLNFVTWAGWMSIIFSIGMYIYASISVLTSHAIWGWSSLICSIWFIGGLIMVSLGIVGEYIGKIYLETKRRPRYRVEQKL
ncbi:glycosyltransferase family 2 protein [Alloscardovia venturai]|uniref:Glycosyltransferase family 2 protein n=1 Tax=Alloscardovia venturai TaxID=1769421 RepID=A0ABW2Y5D9_9BIFI